MKPIVLTAFRRVIPTIYAYTTPEIARHDGWVKIGYTEQEVGKRLAQQTHTADVLYRLQWRGNAVYEDGSGETFRDSDFHLYLAKNRVERIKDTEWFHLSGEKSKEYFYRFKETRGVTDDVDFVSPYNPRKEQRRAFI